MYSIRLPGKLAFYDAGPKSQNTRLSRTVLNSCLTRGGNLCSGTRTPEKEIKRVAGKLVSRDTDSRNPGSLSKTLLIIVCA